MLKANNVISTLARPLYFYKLYELLSRLDDPGFELLILSKQTNVKGARKYFCIRSKTFIESYDMVGNHNHLYEVIRENCPVKPFLDLEYQVSLNTEFDPVLALTQLKVSLSEVVKSDCGVKIGNGDFLVLTSSSLEKSSFHLIINHDQLRMSNIKSLSVLVHKSIDRCTEAGVSLEVANKSGSTCFVDTGVYCPNQNFRIFLSMKLGSNRKLLVDSTDEHHLFLATNPSSFPKGNLNRSILEASLITTNHKSSLKQSMNDTKNNLSSFSTTKTVPSSFLRTNYHSELNPVVQQAVISATNSRAIILSVKLKGDLFSLKLDPKPFCINSNKVHVNNNTYVLVNTKSMEFCINCLHPNCRSVKKAYVKLG